MKHENLISKMTLEEKAVLLSGHGEWDTWELKRLGIPSMIIGETSMSFLGLGIQSPATSWGVLLKEAQDVTSIALHPWCLIPLFFVVLTVLAINFLGDGMRDAADPYK